MVDFIGRCNTGKRLHVVRKVLASIHIFQFNGLPSIHNTFSQLDEEEVVEINLTGRGAAQWTPFSVKEYENSLVNKMYFNKHLNVE